MIRKIAAISAAFAASCALVACAPAVEETATAEGSEAASPTPDTGLRHVRYVNTDTCRVGGKQQGGRHIQYDYELNHVLISEKAIPFHQIINHAGQARVRAVYDAHLAGTSCPAPVFLIEATPPQPAATVVTAPAPQPAAPAATPVTAPAPAP